MIEWKNTISFTAQIRCTDSAKKVINRKLPRVDTVQIQKKLDDLNKLFKKDTKSKRGEYVIDLSRAPDSPPDQLILMRNKYEIEEFEAEEIMNPKELNKKFVDVIKSGAYRIAENLAKATGIKF